MSKETKIRSVDKVTSMNELSITVFLRRKWVECGVRNKENENGFKKRREFQSTHGFRKFFKSKMTNAGLGVLHVEALLGHLSGLQGAYFRPTQTELQQTYLKGMASLFVDEALTIKSEVGETLERQKMQIYSHFEKEFQSLIQFQQQKMETMEREIRELKIRNTRFSFS